MEVKSKANKLKEKFGKKKSEGSDAAYLKVHLEVNEMSDGIDFSRKATKSRQSTAARTTSISQGPRNSRSTRSIRSESCKP